VKEVRIVNVDLEKTTVMDKEFKWWFGQTPHMSDQYQDRLRINDTELPLLFIHSYRDDVTIGPTETHMPDSTREDDILGVRRKNKEYVPEKFTYFWRKKSPFSQPFKCKITIDGKDYSCTEQRMMEQKALCFEEIG